MKPYSESCDQNREPIFSIIAPLLSARKSLLEIGSGTGQHAVYFAGDLPHLTWQTSDVEDNHAGIKAWINDSHLSNVMQPLEIDTTQDHWPAQRYDVVYSANTAHIMNWQAVEGMFAGVGKVLAEDGCFLLYGPFNYNGDYTSDSNRRFDKWLKDRDPSSGIRDFEALNELALAAEMRLVEDFEMPVNNRLLYWQKA
jgi:cyclopropane fatty-acyl-phospholipid synthase-like methyltransferase